MGSQKWFPTFLTSGGSYMLYVSDSSDFGSMWRVTDTSDATVEWVKATNIHGMAKKLEAAGNRIYGVDTRCIHLLTYDEFNKYMSLEEPLCLRGDSQIPKLAIMRHNVYESGISIGTYIEKSVKDVVSLALQGSGIPFKWDLGLVAGKARCFVEEGYGTYSRPGVYGFAYLDHSRPGIDIGSGWPLNLSLAHFTRQDFGDFWRVDVIRNLHRRLYILRSPGSSVKRSSEPIVYVSGSNIYREVVEEYLSPILVDMFNFVRSCTPELKNLLFK